MDLNLFRVFLAVYDTQSVSRAAVELDMHQSAVSRGLNKLRADLDDPLFVKTAHGMEPTPAAHRIAEPVRASLQAFKQAVDARAAFDPATTTSELKLLTGDIAESGVITFMMPALSRQAPNARIHFVSKRPADVEMALERGDIDLALGFFPELKSANVFSVGLTRSHFGFFCREGHPLADRRLSQAEFDSLRHVSLGGECSIVSIVERWFQEKGIERDVAIRTSHFYSVPLIIGSSDLVAVLPTNDQGAWLYGGTAGRIIPPFELPVAQLRLYWHRAMHADERHQWWRGLLSSTVRGGWEEVAPMETVRLERYVAERAKTGVAAGVGRTLKATA